MKLKLASSSLGTTMHCTATKTCSNTYKLDNEAIFGYSIFSPALYVDQNVYMIETIGAVIRVYIQTLNKSGKWSKNVVLSTDIKAVIYEA